MTTPQKGWDGHSLSGRFYHIKYGSSASESGGIKYGIHISSINHTKNQPPEESMAHRTPYWMELSTGRFIACIIPPRKWKIKTSSAESNNKNPKKNLIVFIIMLFVMHSIYQRTFNLQPKHRTCRSKQSNPTSSLDTKLMAENCLGERLGIHTPFMSLKSCFSKRKWKEWYPIFINGWKIFPITNH